MSCCCCPAPRLVTETVEVDPRACNGAEIGPDGLLVPRTQIQGFVGSAPGRVSNDFPSVDTFVTAPAAGVCPENWQVRAYLTPVSGQAVLGADGNLPNNSVWVNTALNILLPEPGRYFVAWDAVARLCATASPGSNKWISVRVQNVTTGAIIGGTAKVAAQHQFQLSPGTNMQACNGGSASISHIIRVTAPTRLRLQGLLAGGVGGAVTGAIRAGAHVSMIKYSD